MRKVLNSSNITYKKQRFYSLLEKPKQHNLFMMRLTEEPECRLI